MSALSWFCFAPVWGWLNFSLCINLKFILVLGYIFCFFLLIDGGCLCCLHALSTTLLFVLWKGAYHWCCWLGSTVFWFLAGFYLIKYWSCFQTRFCFHWLKILEDVFWIALYAFRKQLWKQNHFREHKKGVFNCFRFESEVIGLKL